MDTLALNDPQEIEALLEQTFPRQYQYVQGEREDGSSTILCLYGHLEISTRGLDNLKPILESMEKVWEGTPMQPFQSLNAISRLILWACAHHLSDSAFKTAIHDIEILLEPEEAPDIINVFAPFKDSPRMKSRLLQTLEIIAEKEAKEKRTISIEDMLLKALKACSTLSEIFITLDVIPKWQAYDSICSHVAALIRRYGIDGVDKSEEAIKSNEELINLFTSFDKTLARYPHVRQRLKDTYEAILKEVFEALRNVDKPCNISDFSENHRIIHTLYLLQEIAPELMGQVTLNPTMKEQDRQALIKAINRFDTWQRLGENVEEFRDFTQNKLIYPILLQINPALANNREQLAELAKQIIPKLYSTPAQLVNAIQDWHQRAHHLGAITLDIRGHEDLTWASLPHAKYAQSDFEFVPLKTPFELIAEGQVMEHCVGTFVANAALAKSFIISLRVGEKSPWHEIAHEDGRVGTMEITVKNKKLLAKQMYGHRNAELPSELTAICRAYVASLNQGSLKIDGQAILQSKARNQKLNEKIPMWLEIGFDWRNPQITETMFGKLKNRVLPDRKHGLSWQQFRGIVLQAAGMALSQNSPAPTSTPPEPK